MSSVIGIAGAYVGWGFKASAWLVLVGAIGAIGAPDLKFNFFPSFLYGLSLMLATSIGISFMTFAFLIKKYGNDSLRSFLNYISKAKDKFLFNIDYLMLNFFKFNKNVLCLNNILLQGISIFSLIEAKSILSYFLNYDNNLFFYYYLGLLIFYKLLESKQYVPLFASLAMNSFIITSRSLDDEREMLHLLTHVVSIQICQATILSALILGAISLLSFLVTSSKKIKTRK